MPWVFKNASSPHRDLRDVAPLAGALGVAGVDGAVAPLGGGGGEGRGVGVVGAGVDGYALRWEERDEDITVPGILAGHFQLPRKSNPASHAQP